MKLKSLFLFLFLSILNLPFYLSGQIVDDPYATPFSIEAHAKAPGHQLQVQVSTSDLPFPLFGENLESLEGHIADQIFECAVSRDISDLPDLADPLFATIIPGETYYVHARLSSPYGSNFPIIELDFDIPSGYRLFVEGSETTNIREKIYQLKSWKFILERTNEVVPIFPGDLRGPYLGSKYLLDINLGEVPTGFNAGFLRLSRDAFIGGQWDRSLLVGSQRFEDIIFIKDSGASNALLKQVYVPEIGITELTDLTDGCELNFYQATSEPPMYDHDNDPATPLIYQTAGLSLRKTITFTAELISNGTTNNSILNIVSTVGSVSIESRIEYHPVGAGNWYLFKGKMSDGMWLSKVRYVTSPRPSSEPAGIIRTISIGGVEDRNLNNVSDFGEEIPFEVTSEEIYEYIAPHSGGAQNILRLIERTVAPNSPSNEKQTIFNYVSSGDARSQGKIETITSPTGQVTLFEYYGVDTNAARKMRGCIKNVITDYSIAFDSDAILNFDSAAKLINYFEYEVSFDGDTFAAPKERLRESFIRNAGGSETKISKTETISSFVIDWHDENELMPQTKQLIYLDDSTQWFGEKIEQRRSKSLAINSADRGAVYSRVILNSSLLSEVSGSFYDYYGSIFYNTSGNYDVSTNTFTASFNGAEEVLQQEFIGTVFRPTGYDLFKQYSNKRIDRIFSKDQRVFSEKEYVYPVPDGDAILIRDVKYSYDIDKRLSSVTDLITGEIESWDYLNGQLYEKFNADGSVYRYQYDALGRQIRESRSPVGPLAIGNGQTVAQGEIIEEKVYDPQGRVRYVRKKDALNNPTEVLEEERVYSITGELILKTLACDSTLELNRTLSTVADEGWIKTETHSNGTISITTHFKDGRIKKIESSGEPMRFYHYGITPAGNLTELVRYGSDDTSAPYEYSEKNWAGKVVKTKIPVLDDATSSGAVVEQESTRGYDVRNRLKFITQTGLPTKRFDYGKFGEGDFTVREWTALDGDTVDDFDPAYDPANESYSSYELIGEDVWLIKRDFTYAGDASSTRTLAGKIKTRLSGLAPNFVSEQHLIDNQGHSIIETQLRDGLKRTVMVNAPTGSGTVAQSKSIYVGGLLAQEEDSLGRVATYEYDSLGRLSLQIGFEGGIHRRVYQPDCSKVDYEQVGVEGYHIGYTYYNSGIGSLGQVEYRFVLSDDHPLHDQSSANISPSALDTSAENVISVQRFVYDSAGRINELYQAGEKSAKSTYDNFGRRETLKIFQDDSVSSLIDWDYDIRTSQLVARKDTHPSGIGMATTSYKYYNTGAIYKQIDPRNVATTYFYGEASDGYGYGQIKSIEFDDVTYSGENAISTASIEYSYNRMGALATLDNGVTGLQIYSYDNNSSGVTLRLEEVTFAGEFYGNHIKKFKPRYELADGVNELKGRLSGFDYKNSDDITTVGQGYFFDELGRYSTIIADGFWGLSHLEGTEFDLSYDNSGRLKKVEMPLLSRVDGGYLQSFEWNPLGQLETVSSGHDGDANGFLNLSNPNDFVNARYGYTYDEAGRKKWEQADGFLYGRYPSSGLSTQFNYDHKGRLNQSTTHFGLSMEETAPKVARRDIEYVHDTAGNLTDRLVDGVSFPLVPTASHAYESQTNSTYVTSSGMSNSPISIDGVPPSYQVEDYFLHTVSINNANSPLWKETVINSGNQSVSIGSVVKKAQQTYSYDDSGNLLSDELWNYRYDALNRLRKMERPENVISGLPEEKNIRLEFMYDEQNRRVEKRVVRRASGEIISHDRFIYDGWNLLGKFKVEVTGSNEIVDLQSRYVWRTGIADTGAYGLLMVAGDHDGDSLSDQRAYYPGYDGRGNLTHLADNLNGVAQLIYEYDPYGRSIRSESAVGIDPNHLGTHFGFATQYRDTETGLIYFGNRYYHPHMARFINKDPIREKGGLNLYAYAANDPINYTDYRGLCASGNSGSGYWRRPDGTIYHRDEDGNVTELSKNIVGVVYTGDGYAYGVIGGKTVGEKSYVGLVNGVYGLAPFPVAGSSDSPNIGAINPFLSASVSLGGGGGVEDVGGVGGGFSGSNTLSLARSLAQGEKWSKEDCDKLLQKIDNNINTLRNLAGSDQASSSVIDNVAEALGSYNRFSNTVFAAADTMNFLYGLSGEFSSATSGRNYLSYHSTGQNIGRIGKVAGNISLGVDSFNFGSAILEGDVGGAVQSGASVSSSFLVAAVPGAGVPLFIGNSIIYFGGERPASRANEAFSKSIDNLRALEVKILSKQGAKITQQWMNDYAKNCQ